MTDTIERKPSKQERWRERNPKAAWAHSALRSAIRRGILEPEPCAVCGDPKSEAHHWDYSRPADVTWLCRGHHKAEHRRLRSGGAHDK